MRPADSLLSAPSPDALAHSQRLREAIVADIASQDGWIPFSRYLELVLYAPGLGYYAAGARKFGAEGDFVTAPEISPLFARLVARQVAQVLALVGGDVLELGPGSGVLARDLAAELAVLGASPPCYRLLEVSADLRERQHALLAGSAQRFAWLDRLPEKFTGVVLANEVLDVVPFHVVARLGGKWSERGVGLDSGALAWRDRTLGEGELLDRARQVFPQGGGDYLSEIGLAGEALARTLCERLERGLVIFIDYGFAAREFYHPQRSLGTLRCHYRHRSHDDPFLYPGLQDITAHVDFSAIAAAGEKAGARVLGFATQANFLLSCGMAELVAASDPSQAAAHLRLTNALNRLVSPAEMGELFKVLALGKGVAAPLLGFHSGRAMALQVGQ
jgi:SAM-dependent MidA family methyltransferase